MTELVQALAELSTAHVTDAYARLGETARCGPFGLAPIAPHWRVEGHIQVVRHVGSVDLLLEAMGRAAPGSVLLVEDLGRHDRACVGDLVAIEAAGAGLSGIVIDGCHRDTEELIEIGLPVFSLGAHPSGPLEVGDRPVDPFTECRFGDRTAVTGDLVVGDRDGVVLIGARELADVVRHARAVRDTEIEHRRRFAAGEDLRTQFGFADYLTARETDPTLTFRQHLAGALGQHRGVNRRRLRRARRRSCRGLR